MAAPPAVSQERWESGSSGRESPCCLVFGVRTSSQGEELSPDGGRDFPHSWDTGEHDIGWPGDLRENNSAKGS